MNPVLLTDSYKVGHWKMYPENTEGVFSYFESRAGAKFKETMFFGLTHILRKYLSKKITALDVIKAEKFFDKHLGPGHFNKEGWNHIVYANNGYLPLIIKAVPEGTIVPTGNVLMTVENTDPKCAWVVNYVETILSQIWYPCTVATLSNACKKMFTKYALATSDNLDFINFQLHDFGYRGVSSNESASIGGASHLINFNGTDTLAGITYLSKNGYTTLNDMPAFSVAATEHSVMTSEGPEGEEKVLAHLLKEFPTGILSVVADSYDIYNFVDNIIGKKFKNKILERDGVFVVRPDSITPAHDTPELLMKYVLNSLWCNFDGTVNSKGYKVLNPKIKVIWGDGIDYEGIQKILKVAKLERFSSENMVFGMGGGLLQKINRDTQRFAFKCSAQKRNGEWIDIFKNPKDVSKISKKGRLRLIKNEDNLYETVNDEVITQSKNLLETVFLNGEITKRYTLDEVRTNSTNPSLTLAECLV